MEKFKPSDTLPGNPSNMEAKGEINNASENLPELKLGDRVKIITSAGVESNWQFMRFDENEAILGRTIEDSDKMEIKRFKKEDVRKV